MLKRPRRAVSVASVHKACAWLGQELNSFHQHGGILFSLRISPVYSEVDGKIIFYVWLWVRNQGSPQLASTITATEKQKKEATGELAGKQRRAENTDQGRALREAGLGSASVPRGRQCGKKEGIWQVRVSGEMGCKVNKDPERKVRDQNYECSNKKVNEGNQSLTCAPRGQGGAEGNLPSSLTKNNLTLKELLYCAWKSAKHFLN